MANNHILVHRICRGFTISFAGIRLLLKLVTIPPQTIKAGITHGALKSKNVMTDETTKITRVIGLFILIRYALYAAYAKKPIAIG